MKYNNWFRLPLIFLLFMTLISCRKGEYESEGSPVIINDLGEGTGTVTWFADHEYILEGFVFVNDGQVLTIEPGTVIRAREGQGNAASALIVSRGGKIVAEGTPSEPIIFTVEGDDLAGSVPVEARGLWGGVIILGSAPLNVSGGEARIEGIPLYETRGIYGGYDEKDNSGILRYVSIRHCGTSLGEGNEINGLTLGGVGSGTQIDHIEVISSADDGLEIFGGSVNISYLAVGLCDDDLIDCDLGYRGSGQFWFGYQASSYGDKMIEISGGTDPIVGQPYTIPVIYNATLIGRGLEDLPLSLSFNRNGGGTLANSIIMNQGGGISIEYVEGSQDSFQMLELGLLRLESNIFHEVAGDIKSSICNIAAAPGVNTESQKSYFESYFSEAFNEIADPGIEVISGSVNPFPEGNVYDNLEEVPDAWFEVTTFKGAFYTYNWLAGWSLISTLIIDN